MSKTPSQLHLDSPTPLLNRRNFLLTSAAGAIAASCPVSFAADAPKNIRIGLIGAGWWGMVNVQAAFKVGGIEVVAVCDVDSDHLEKSAAIIAEKQGSKPQTFKNYADLIALPDLDAVIIATPPHWHALPFLAALERGLDIYCEKPLAYDIREGRVMADAAKKSDRIVQIGFQRRQTSGIREAREYIQGGNAGNIVQAHAQINYKADFKDTSAQNPPPTLDWDLWCGPAPLLPYSPQVGHFNWRLEKTFGNGHLVDWGIHLIDATRWILGETTPRSVQASGGIYRSQGKITTPDILNVHFDFEKCPVTWSHRIWGAAEFAPELSNGMFFYGEKETVFVTENKWTVIPNDPKAGHQVHEVEPETNTNLIAEFISCVRSRQQPSILTEDAHFSTTTVQLAMIAYETTSKIHWDGTEEKITNSESASNLLKREYRKPWIHPAV